MTLIGFIARVRLDMAHGLLSLSKDAAMPFAVFPFANIFALAVANVILAQMTGKGIKIGECAATALPTTLKLLFLAFLGLCLLCSPQCFR